MTEIMLRELGADPRPPRRFLKPIPKTHDSLALTPLASRPGVMKNPRRSHAVVRRVLVLLRMRFERPPQPRRHRHRPRLLCLVLVTLPLVLERYPTALRLNGVGRIARDTAILEIQMLPLDPQHLGLRPRCGLP